MITKFIQYMYQKTHLSLHPRFVFSIFALLAALLLLFLTFCITALYANSVKTVVPSDAKTRARYDTQMRVWPGTYRQRSDE